MPRAAAGPLAVGMIVMVAGCKPAPSIPTISLPVEAAVAATPTRLEFPTLPPAWTNTPTAVPSETPTTRPTATATETLIPTATFDIALTQTALVASRQLTATQAAILGTQAPTNPESSATPFPPELRQGEIVFLEMGGGNGCQECHGIDGKGNEIGPNIRGQPVEEIKFQLETNPDMDFLVSDADIEAVALYLAWLETQP